MDGQALAAIKIHGVVVNNPNVTISLIENDLPVQAMPGFGPAAELVAWRVTKGATLVVSAKGPNNGHALRDVLCTDATSGLIR